MLLMLSIAFASSPPEPSMDLDQQGPAVEVTYNEPYRFDPGRYTLSRSLDGQRVEVFEGELSEDDAVWSEDRNCDDPDTGDDTGLGCHTRYRFEFQDPCVPAGRWTWTIEGEWGPLAEATLAVTEQDQECSLPKEAGGCSSASGRAGWAWPAAMLALLLRRGRAGTGRHRAST